MKIAYFSPNFPPEIGGMGMACYYTANEIGKSHKVTVFLPKRNVKYKTGNYKIKLFKPWFSYGYADFAPQVFNLVKNFDVVHLYYPYFGIAEFLYLRKLLRKPTPKIVFHHAMETVGTGIVKFVSNLHKKILMPALMKGADMIFVLSQDYTEHSNITPLYKKHPEKFREIPHGVDLSIFCHPDPPAGGEGSLKHGFTVFTAQALDRQHFFKGIDVLIKSIHLLITNYQLPITLVIAGDGPLKSYYEKLASQLGIQDKVKLLGAIDHSQLTKYYNLADVTAIPSTQRTECFSLTAVESMACATPVIVSDWPGVRVTIENNKSGLIVKPNDEKDLAEKIAYLYNNPDVLKSMGDSAHARAQEKFSWQNIAEKVIKHYSSLSS